MLRLFAERGGDPARAGKGDELGRVDVACRAPRRAQLAIAVRPWQARLACRVHGDRAQPHRHRPDIQGGGSDLIFRTTSSRPRMPNP